MNQSIFSLHSAMVSFSQVQTENLTVDAVSDVALTYDVAGNVVVSTEVVGAHLNLTA